MAENDFTKNFDAFLKMQSQYMDAWNTASQKPVEPSMPPSWTANPWTANPWSSSPWASMLNNLWSSPSEQNASANSLFGNMFQQNTMMAQLVKSFEQIVSATSGIKQQENTKQWQSTINQVLDDLQAQLANLGSVPFTASPGMTNSWNELVSFWQQSMQTQFSSMPGITENITPDQLPGLGPNREQYEKLKNLQSHIKKYQEAQQEYTQSFSTFWPEVIEQLKVKITNANESDDENLTSVRALFNLWTDAAESVYAKTTKSENYQKAYSKLINTSMALKIAIDEIQQDSLATLNIPTRNEIDTLSERLQRTRRENRLLRKELNELKTAFENSLKKTAPKRKPAARRKNTSVKKSSTIKAKKNKTVKKKSSIKKSK